MVSKIRRILAGLRTSIYIYIPFPLSGGIECVSRSFYGWFSCYRDAVPKQCCGLGSPPVRWSILGVGIVGLVCAGAGVLLGALRATGRDHFAVALLMIGKWSIDFPFSLLPISILSPNTTVHLTSDPRDYYILFKSLPRKIYLSFFKVIIYSLFSQKRERNENKSFKLLRLRII